MRDKERWLELCEQAAVEQDADKLFTLIHEITRLLDEKEQRLQARSKNLQQTLDEKNEADETLTKLAETANENASDKTSCGAKKPPSGNNRRIA
jgi:ABC-type transporter Mla subunit MlaD